MIVKIINDKERKQIENILKKQYGITSLNFPFLIKSGHEKILAYTGGLGIREINKLSAFANIEQIGLYLGKEDTLGIRLSIEGSQIFGKQGQIKNSILELNNIQSFEWMSGQDLEIGKDSKIDKPGLLIIKHKDDFLGTGKASTQAKKISNFIPKERRLKISER
jgi:NOL1/NOP2/fmu family ribosome biogenesis protein